MKGLPEEQLDLGLTRIATQKRAGRKPGLVQGRGQPRTVSEVDWDQERGCGWDLVLLSEVNGDSWGGDGIRGRE